MEDNMIALSINRRFLGLIVLAAVGFSTTVNAGLIHRYSFKDKAVKDSVGKVNATLKGGAKIEDAKLVLDNGDKTSDDANLSYLEFNDSIIPKSGSVSLVVWLTAKENKPFARIIDIGDKSGADG